MSKKTKDIFTSVIAYINVGNSMHLWKTDFHGDKDSDIRRLIGLENDEYDLIETDSDKHRLGEYQEDFNYCDDDAEDDLWDMVLEETNEMCWYDVNKDYILKTFCVVFFDTTIEEVNAFLKREPKCYDLESSIRKFLKKRDNEYNLKGVEINYATYSKTFKDIYIDKCNHLQVTYESHMRESKVSFGSLTMTEKYAIYGNIIDTEIEL